MKMLKSLITFIISTVMKDKSIILSNLMKTKNKFDHSKFQSVSLGKSHKHYLMILILQKTSDINFLFSTEQSMLSMKNHLLKLLIKITKEDFKHVRKVYLFGLHQVYNLKNLTSIRITHMMRSIRYSHQLEDLQGFFRLKTNAG